MTVKACTKGYKLKGKKCVPTVKYKIGIKKELNLILQKGKINSNLRTAVQEIRKAIEKDDVALATELTGVKSYITGAMTDKELSVRPRSIQKYRFREDDEYNRNVLGRSVYGRLDGLHHDLAYSQGQLPRGMMVFSPYGVERRPYPKGKHPVVRMMEKEQEEVIRAVDVKRGKG